VPEPRFDAILFDLDETLIDDDFNYQSSIKATSEAIYRGSGRVSSARVEQAYRTYSSTYWGAMTGVSTAPSGSMKLEDIRHHVWTKALKMAGDPDPSIVGVALLAYEITRRENPVLYPETNTTLARLKPHFKLGMITNGDLDQQQPKLDATDLPRWFQSITTPDCGCMKPQVEIFDIALKSLSTTADRAIFVGDSIVWDVAGANAAGIYSIWINRGGVQRSDDDPLPIAEIDSLAGLDEIVFG
jgi:putative hydrolase of the HAD superfamily